MDWSTILYLAAGALGLLSVFSGVAKPTSVKPSEVPLATPTPTPKTPTAEQALDGLKTARRYLVAHGYGAEADDIKPLMTAIIESTFEEPQA